MLTYPDAQELIKKYSKFRLKEEREIWQGQEKIDVLIFEK